MDSAEGPIIAFVPARNSRRVGETVVALLGTKRLDRVVVIDDGSTDDTAERALEAGATVLALPHNRGKGDALNAAISRFQDASVYLLVDADLAETASHVVKLLDPVTDGSADLAIAAFPPASGRGGFGLIKRKSRWLIERECGYVAIEPLSGQRAVRGSLLRRLALAPRFGVEAAMTVDAVRLGARITEIPLPLDHEHTGRNLRGFKHRGGQAIDIVRAMAQRAMSTRQRLIAAVGLVAVVVAVAGFSMMPHGRASRALGGTKETASSTTATGTADAMERFRRREKVILVTVSNLSLADLDRGVMPHIAELMSNSGGALASRAPSDPEDQRTAYATLGAGSPLKVPAATVGWPQGAGALGETLRSKGRITGYVGARSGGVGVDRPGLLAIGDRHGNVDVLDPGSLPAAPDNALDRRLAERSSALAAVLQRSDVVLVDLGGAQEPWPKSAGPMSNAVKAQRHERRLDQVRVADAMVGRIAETNPDSLVVVVGLSPALHWRLTPLAASGGATGALWSPSTRRPGLSVLTDVAPTVLNAAGVAVPQGMVGRPVAAGPQAADLAAVRELHRRTILREALTAKLTMALIVTLSITYLAALFGMSKRMRAKRQIRVFAETLALSCAAVPAVSFLYRLAPVALQQPIIAASAVAIGSVALAVTARRFRRHALSPLVVIASVTAVIMAFDAASAGALQNVSLLGYTPLGAARFYGMGNFGFAAFGSAVVLLAGSLVAASPRRSDGVVTAAAVLASAAVVQITPSMGADFGAALVLLPIGIFAVMAWGGVRITARRAVLTMCSSLVAAAAMVMVEVSFGSESHVGRLFVGDRAGIVATVERKAQANVKMLTTSNWVWILAAFVVFCAVSVVLARGRFTWFTMSPTWRSTGFLLALFAVVGSALNDSGVAIAAMVSIYGGALLVLLAQRTPFTVPAIIEPPMAAPSATG